MSAPPAPLTQAEASIIVSALIEKQLSIKQYISGYPREDISGFPADCCDRCTHQREEHDHLMKQRRTLKKSAKDVQALIDRFSAQLNTANN